MSEEPWPFTDSDRHGWPDAPSDASEYAKKLYDARLAVREKRTDEEIARAAADRGAARQIELEYFKGVLEVAKGSIDRSRASAEFVQKAAGAIGVIYTALLGVAFSVAERPLPVRGVLPALFLGISIVCATIFLAWLPTREPDPSDLTHDASPAGTPLRDRLAVFFIRWNRRAAVDRRKWLRASVVGLGAAIVLLPAPFIPLGDQPSPVTTTFPAPSAAAPGENIELRKILYQAQITEVSTTGAQPLTGDSDELWWVLAAALGVLVIVLPQFPREPNPKGPEGPRPKRLRRAFDRLARRTSEA